ncbi:MAG TPA: hypothetical protein DDZ51_10735 [Planctomycetaceae bacterium]|nr:hypothetical protein [Planctomycetaceae bacterium]
MFMTSKYHCTFPDFAGAPATMFTPNQSAVKALILAATFTGPAFAQDESVSTRSGGNVARSTIVDLKQSQENLTQLTRDLHTEPVEAIKRALTSDLQATVELRRRIDRDPSNRMLLAQFDNSLSKILANVDQGLERFIDGESQVMQAIDQNISVAKRSHARAAAELQELQTRRAQIGPEREKRQIHLRKMLDIYGSEAELPEELVAQAEKMRADIRTLDRLERTLNATAGQRQQLIDSLSRFASNLQSRKYQVGVTYHAAVGHRNIVLHLVEYRSARADRVQTEAEIAKFNQQLSELLQSIGDVNFGELVDVGLDR